MYTKADFVRRMFAKFEQHDVPVIECVEIDQKKLKKKLRNKYYSEVRRLSKLVAPDSISGYDRNNLLTVTKDNFSELQTSDKLVMDHKISVSCGYKHGIPPEVISHVSNLRYIPSKDNNKKGYQCLVDDDNQWILDHIK